MQGMKLLAVWVLALLFMCNASAAILSASQHDAHQIPPEPTSMETTSLGEEDFLSDELDELLDASPTAEIEDDMDRCTVEFCAMNGAGTQCMLATGESMTCDGWHSLEGDALCGITCSRQCLPESLQPLASNGQRYCTTCILKFVSCESGFEVFGPVPETCSVDYCSKVGRAAACDLPNGGVTTTCGGYADGGITCIEHCSLECRTGPTAPRDNEGTVYCSECQLRGASCSQGFAIFGPVNV